MTRVKASAEQGGSPKSLREYSATSRAPGRQRASAGCHRPERVRVAGQQRAASSTAGSMLRIAAATEVHVGIAARGEHEHRAAEAAHLGKAEIQAKAAT